MTKYIVKALSALGNVREALASDNPWENCHIKLANQKQAEQRAEVDAAPGVSNRTNGIVRTDTAHGLLIDCSGSMDDEMTHGTSPLDHRSKIETKLDAAKDAVQRFVVRVAENSPKDIVLIGSFASRGKMIEPARSAENLRREMSSILAKICLDGSTNTAAGVRLMHEALIGVRNVTSRRLIILTDGFSDDSRKSIEMACRAKLDGILIEIIGVGKRSAEVNEMELKEMCSIVDGRHRYWFISQADELVQRFQKLALTLREF